MRPLELVVNGFRSYAQPATFDWRDRHLVGIVGPIGSGKSSILDAITFALYGRTPATARDTGTLINQRQDLAQVQFTFRVDGSTWQVVRAIKRRGQSQHVLYPFDEDAWKPLTGEAITGATTVTARIEKLLGLDFNAFRRSVLLAQNHFAEFLNATPGDRDNVLKGVFGLDRVDAMREIARDRQREAEGAAKALEAQIAMANQMREQIASWQGERTGADERRRALEALRPRVEALTRKATEAAQAVDAATARAAQLDDMRQGLPAREQSDATIAAFTQQASSGATLRAQREAAEAAATQARSARDAAIKEVGDRAHLDAAKSALHALTLAAQARDGETARMAEAKRDYEAAMAALEAYSAAVKAAEAEAKKATSALTRAAKVLEGADAARHLAERVDLALTLRSELEAGDLCPVCGRKIAKLPGEEESPDLDEAEARVVAAQEQHTAAQRALNATSSKAAAAQATFDAGQRAVTEATARSEAAAKNLGTAAAAHADAQRAVVALLGKGDPAAKIDAIASRLDAADRAVATAEAAERTAREAETKAAATLEAAQRNLTSLRVRLASVAARLDIEAGDDDTVAAVQALLASVRERWAAERKAATEAKAAAEAQSQTSAKERAAILAEGGVPPGEEYDHATAEVGKRIAALDALIAQAEAQIAATADAEREGRTISERRETYRRLADDLTPSKFLKYLLEDERTALAEIGSERFEHLSAGRYRFTEDGTFSVVDLTAAESSRPAETLSGGETFLASLSLALALAEMVNRGGGRLDAFFLDEGFGSLDEEHLDLAMQGVERLVTESDDRLVVIVSHVPALRERIEDLIILDRDPGTGDTIVRRGATAHV